MSKQFWGRAAGLRLLRAGEPVPVGTKTYRSIFLFPNPAGGRLSRSILQSPGHKRQSIVELVHRLDSSGSNQGIAQAMEPLVTAAPA